MIMTTTFNPSIDYLIESDKIKLGELNRTNKESVVIGGKGINVSLMLNNLRIQNTATGFIGGFTGQFIKNEINKFEYIKEDFLQINNNQNTRINIKMKIGNEETEINANGCLVDKANFKKLKSKVMKLGYGDIFILSGSLANGLTNNAYYELSEICFINNVKLIVDSTKNNLLQTLEFKPFLIKPNIYELMEAFNVEITKDEEVIKYSKKLQIMGAKNVLVSMGEKGSILVTKNTNYKAYPIKINPVSTIGAGDSMVAGFIAQYEKTKSYKASLKLASACSIATALCKSIGELELVEKYLNLTKIEEI